jgi:hypothetical protein
MKVKLVTVLAVTFVVLPSMASAANDPDLTYPTGTLLSTSSKIRAHNVGELKLTTSEGTYTCSYGETTGTVTKNNGTEVEANITTGAYAGTGVEDKCTTSGSPIISNFTLTPSPSVGALPWCLQSTPTMKEDEAQIRGGACGGEAKPLRLSLGVKAPASYCIYERSGAIKGTYATHPGDLLLTTTGVETTLVRGSFSSLCPSFFNVDSTMTVESDKEVNEPAYMSSGPRLTFPTGTSLATGSKLRATNVESVFLTSGAIKLTCTTSQWTGTLTKNNGSEIEGNIETASIGGTGTGGSCTTGSENMKWTLSPPSTNGLPWCFRATSAMASDEFQIRGGKCTEGTKPIRYIWESASESSFECVYERATGSPISATYTTHPEDAKLAISEAEFNLVLPSGACPPSFSLNSTFTFERDNTPENAPLYIS